jgi:hypothetical protein
MNIPHGTCHCGCGQITSIIDINCAARGLVKGQHREFLKGHHQRISPVDYLEEDHGYKTPCWVWQRGKTDLGYGRMWQDGKQCSATRVYYARVHGSIPDELELDHLCRFPLCVNPEHLEPVTGTINKRRGIQPKLSASLVLAIRADVGSQRSIAEKYSVSQMCINKVLTRKTWKDV